MSWEDFLAYLIIGAGVGGLFFAIIFALAVLGAAVGAFVGWAVGLTPLGAAVLKIWLALTHVECELWELGAFLGFITGFFRGVTMKGRDE